ncbi:serine/threonine-protein phosphatase [Actinoallomurus sp. NBC_01490]|uniref:PP2C family protein-serine/threonine phosphatase n=1 Tax=Actinoallomurus sp. NBC_01490 TaxID=2903557 RepID=UPI002E3157A7|nr:PP2C family protein-serine/threonine phosphatase [Actinoallomurus sp. NBC_01490]
MFFITRSEDVTEFVAHRRRLRSRRSGDGDGPDAFPVLEAELYSRATELYEVNEKLGMAYARERKVALTLQRAMLPAADGGSRADVAVRYLPAVDSLNVCGELLQPDGTVHFLDQSTDPPLGVRVTDLPRPQVELAYAPGATLVLYTDGLVERRGEDIGDGLRRLTEGLRRHAPLDPEPLAEVLLSDLGVAGGAADDTALVVIRL